MNYQGLFNDIYEQVFCQTYSEAYYVFLCGGVGPECVRNSVRKMLEQQGYQILYPEDLFVDTISRDKKADLLDYENLLAKNADVVCVICESPGSFAELGAFVQSDAINTRLVVAINSRFRRDKSFIMLGPIRHLRKINEESIVEYQPKDLDVFCSKLKKSFNHIKKKWPRGHSMQSFNNLSTYIAFIPILLFFFKHMDRALLHKELKSFLKSKDMLPSNYNDLFNAAVKYLIKTRIAISTTDEHLKQEQFSLSDLGEANTRAILSKSRIPYSNRLHDKIRCSIMRVQLNN